MDPYSGWIEKWKKGRFVTALKASYRHLDGRDAKRILDQDHYRETRMDHLHALAQRSSLYETIRWELTGGKLTLVGYRPFIQGSHVEVALFLPRYQRDLKFTAEIGPTESFTEMQETLYRAGLKLLSVHRGDIQGLEEQRHVQRLRHQIKYRMERVQEGSPAV